MRQRVGRLVVVAALSLLAGACQREESPSIEAPPEGGVTLSVTGENSVRGNVLTLAFVVRGIQIVPADGDTSGNTGHFHVFVDRDPVAAGVVIPREPGIIHSVDNPLRLTGLSVGPHTLVIVLGDGSHQRIEGVEVRHTVEVQGPAVQATVPATNPAGQPVKVEMKAEGVTIKAADGDTSGATGHFHVFIDRELTPPGQPIPKEAGIIHSAEGTVDLEGLAPGDHFIWVVLADGNHVPLVDGNAAHRVTFTIT